MRSHFCAGVISGEASHQGANKMFWLHYWVCPKVVFLHLQFMLHINAQLPSEGEICFHWLIELVACLLTCSLDEHVYDTSRLHQHKHAVSCVCDIVHAFSPAPCRTYFNGTVQ